MNCITKAIGTVVLCSAAMAANGGPFISKITKVFPGVGNSFEFDTENPIFRAYNCGFFKMGHFTNSDPEAVERTYSAVLAALAARKNVTVWLDDEDNCKVDAIFLHAD